MNGCAHMYITYHSDALDGIFCMGLSSFACHGRMKYKRALVLEYVARYWNWYVRIVWIFICIFIRREKIEGKKTSLFDVETYGWEPIFQCPEVFKFSNFPKFYKISNISEFSRTSKFS